MLRIVILHATLGAWTELKRYQILRSIEEIVLQTRTHQREHFVKLTVVASFVHINRVLAHSAHETQYSSVA